MKKDRKYDPEDIESLLMHKQFYELYPEEKEFVLQFIEGPEEYESMRKTLFELRNASKNGEWLDPDPSLKAELMKEFATENKSGFRVWLNSLFVMPEVIWYKQPAFRLAMATCVVVFGIVIVMRNSGAEGNEIAAIKPDTVNESTTDTVPTSKSDSSTGSLLAENRTESFPQAPAPVEEFQTINLSEVQEDLSPVSSMPAAAAEVNGAENDAFVSDDYIKEEAMSKAEAEDIAQNASPMEELNEVETVSIATSRRKTVTLQSKQVGLNTSVPVSDQKDILGLLFTAN